VKARVGCVQMRGLIVNRALNRADKPCAARGNSFASFTEKPARIAPHHESGELAGLALKPVKPIANASFQTKRTVVQPLIQLIQQRIHAPLCALHMETVNPLACMEKLEARSAFNPHFQRRHTFSDVVLSFGN
jgi:hypothetical protein